MLGHWSTTRTWSGRRSRWLLWWGPTITSNCPAWGYSLFLSKPLNTFNYLIRAKYLDLTRTGTKRAGCWCPGKTCGIDISFNKILLLLLLLSLKKNPWNHYSIPSSALIPLIPATNCSGTIWFTCNKGFGVGAGVGGIDDALKKEQNN